MTGERMKQERRNEIQGQRQYSVLKANELVQKARYDLNLQELKLLSYIISKVKPTDTVETVYTIYVKDFCQVCGIDYASGKNYKMVKDHLKKLRDSSFWIVEETGKETLVGWIAYPTIDKGSGKIELQIDKRIHKYILDLYDNYTQYQLISTLPMKSAYSFRLYELLKSYAFTKRHTFQIDELKKQLAADRYVNFKDFRRAVLETATKEINLYTDIEIQWEPVTYGRKVVEIIFTIRERDAWEQMEAETRATNQIEGQLSIFDYYK